MKVLIIGGAGFIGSHIARACLAEGLEVRVLHRSTSSLLALEDIYDKVERVMGDLNDPVSLEKATQDCDWIFFSAAYSPKHSLHLKRQMNVALDLLENLLIALKGRNFKRFIYTSTIGTIGQAPSGTLADEETLFHAEQFRGTYHQIKYAMEQRVLKEIRLGLPGVIVNPSFVYGDYDVKPSTGRAVIRIVRAQVPFMLDAKANVIDARDLGRAQVRAAEKGRIGERYILGGTNTTAVEFARLTAKIAGVKPPPVINIPVPIVKAACNLCEYLDYYLRIKNLLYPAALIDGMKHGQHYDCSKAESELGLSRTSLEETIRREIEWFRQHHYL